MNCVECGKHMIDGSLPKDLIYARGSVPKSRAANANGRCRDCARPFYASRTRGSGGEYLASLPRYCTCGNAFHRDPTLPEQCTRCWRRIHPDLDTEIVR